MRRRVVTGVAWFRITAEEPSVTRTGRPTQAEEAAAAGSQGFSGEPGQKKWRQSGCNDTLLGVLAARHVK